MANLTPQCQQVADLARTQNGYISRDEFDELKVGSYQAVLYRLRKAGYVTVKIPDSRRWKITPPAGDRPMMGIKETKPRKPSAFDKFLTVLLCMVLVGMMLVVFSNV